MIDRLIYVCLNLLARIKERAFKKEKSDVTLMFDLGIVDEHLCTSDPMSLIEDSAEEHGGYKLSTSQ